MPPQRRADVCAFARFRGPRLYWDRLLPRAMWVRVEGGCTQREVCAQHRAASGSRAAPCLDPVWVCEAAKQLARTGTRWRNISCCFPSLFLDEGGTPVRTRNVCLCTHPTRVCTHANQVDPFLGGQGILGLPVGGLFTRVFLMVKTV